MKFNQYFCALPNCKYHFKDGTEARFVGGVYRTSKPKEIAELDAEVAGQHELIYVKQGQLQVDSEVDDPLAGLKASIRREVEAEYKRQLAAEDAAVNSNKDFGNTGKVEVKPANSVTVKPVSAVSNGIASTERASTEVIKARVASLTTPKV